MFSIMMQEVSSKCELPLSLKGSTLICCFAQAVGWKGHCLTFISTCLHFLATFVTIFGKYHEFNCFINHWSTQESLISLAPCCILFASGIGQSSLLSSGLLWLKQQRKSYSAPLLKWMLQCHIVKILNFICTLCNPTCSHCPTGSSWPWWAQRRPDWPTWTVKW